MKISFICQSRGCGYSMVFYSIYFSRMALCPLHYLNLKNSIWNFTVADITLECLVMFFPSGSLSMIWIKWISIYFNYKDKRFLHHKTKEHGIRIIGIIWNLWPSWNLIEFEILVIIRASHGRCIRLSCAVSYLQIRWN